MFVGTLLPYPPDNLVLDVVLMLLFLGLETLRIFYGETDLAGSCWRSAIFKQPCGGGASLRLEGEPVRALSGLLRVALHPASVCGARRVRAAAADVRPEARVRPRCDPARLLRPGAPLRTGVFAGLFQVNKPEGD